jgi:DNA-directed RNA polymerase II subunit RPB1
MAMQVTSKPLKKALEMRFGILGDKEVRRMSVALVDSEHLLDRYMRPQFGGIHDPRMGTTDRDSLCGTCACSYIECPGHFGHIELAQPVFHGGYVTSVLNVLRSICCECGSLLMRDKALRESIRRRPSGRTRFRMCKETCMKIKECQIDKEMGIGCGHHQPTYRKIGLTIWREYQGNTGPTGPQGAGDPKRPLRAEEIRRILCKISDEDMKLLGFCPKESRPEWMIISALTVAPPPVRPSV